MTADAAPLALGRGGPRSPGSGSAPRRSATCSPASTTTTRRATVDAAWDAGIRYFDTAPLYGHGAVRAPARAARCARDRATSTCCRPRSAGVLRAGRRRRPATIFTDVGDLEPRFDYSRDGVLRSLEESLDRLGVDRARRRARARPRRPRGRRARRRVPDARRSCATRASCGRSAAGMNQHEMLERFVARVDLDCVLLAGRYSLLDRSGAELLDACAARGVGVILGGVFNSGVLVDPDAHPTYDYARRAAGRDRPRPAPAATCARRTASRSAPPRCSSRCAIPPSRRCSSARGRPPRSTSTSTSPTPRSPTTCWRRSPVRTDHVRSRPRADWSGGGMHMRRLASCVVTAALIAGVHARCPTGRPAAPTWSVESSPSPPGPQYGRLNAVACPTAGSCVAVGNTPFNYKVAPNPLTASWDGSTWSAQPPPTTVSLLSGIDCISPTNCSAVGGLGSGSLLHWNGTRWSDVSHPSGSSLIDVSCRTAPTRCFAVGRRSWTAGRGKCCTGTARPHRPCPTRAPATCSASRAPARRSASRSVSRRSSTGTARPRRPSRTRARTS